MKKSTIFAGVLLLGMVFYAQAAIASTEVKANLIIESNVNEEQEETIELELGDLADEETTCPENKIASFDLSINGDMARGEFTIAPGCEDVEISLAAYKAPSLQFALPQQLFDSENGKFDAGQHSLQVSVPDCFFQVDLARGTVITNLTSTNLYGSRLIKAVHGGTEKCDEPPRPPDFPDCEDLLAQGHGDKAHFSEGMHQIAGNGLLFGADDVYSIANGNAVQCFCPPEGMGIQTNFWKTDQKVEGWIEIGNGASWNLDNANYLAKNSEFECEEDDGGSGGNNEAQVKVTKVVVNDNGGTAVVGDFTLKVGQTTVVSGTVVNLQAGSYKVTESGGSQNYTATFSGDCDTDGDITLVSGQTKTCTITNNDKAPAGGGGGTTRPKLKVIKVVINDHDGDAVIGDFTLKVGSTVVLSDVSNEFDAGAYVVSETGGPAGYTATFSGDCDTDGDITLANNQTYTCTITNNDNPPVGGSSGGGSTGGDGTHAAPPGGITLNPPVVAINPPPVVDVGGGEPQILGESIELPRTGMDVEIIYVIFGLWLSALILYSKRLFMWLSSLQS